MHPIRLPSALAAAAVLGALATSACHRDTSAPVPAVCTGGPCLATFGTLALVTANGSPPPSFIGDAGDGIFWSVGGGSIRFDSAGSFRLDVQLSAFDRNASVPYLVPITMVESYTQTGTSFSTRLGPGTLDPQTHVVRLSVELEHSTTGRTGLVFAPQ